MTEMGVDLRQKAEGGKNDGQAVISKVSKWSRQERSC